MQAFEIEEYQDREEAQRGKRSISDLSHKSYLLNAESDPHLSEEFLKIIQLVSPVVSSTL
jgi:hypothetical protein